MKIFTFLLFSKITLCSEKVVVSYFTDWTNTHMNPDQFPYSQVTHINYAFAVVKENFKPYFDTQYLLPKLVSKAHQNGVKVLMSVGGWSGSRYFSLIAKDEAKRKEFIASLTELIKTYNLDGIDIDWEYPGRKGMDCNFFDIKNDSKNFLVLLKEMKKEFGEKLITLAVRVEPFDEVGGASKNMTELSKYVEFINVMAYDINGAWSDTTGPNAPMEYEKGKGLQYSFKSAVSSWLSSGFPKEKLVMGLPFYGRSVLSKVDMTLDPKNIYQPISKAQVPRGDQNDGLWSDPCPNAPYVYSGVWRWRNLRAQNVLISPEEAGPGWNRYWDESSQTPWLFNKQTKQFISYDDPKSIKIKVDYITKTDLRGAMVWSSEQDNGELMSVVKTIINKGQANKESHKSKPF